MKLSPPPAPSPCPWLDLGCIIFFIIFNLSCFKICIPQCPSRPRALSARHTSPTAQALERASLPPAFSPSPCTHPLLIRSFKASLFTPSPFCSHAACS
ncbi:hypothetical protein BC629DRAFT_1451670 [Irpex lacteus]|nr:hypothetical protein BC629DRAFT_1451670 [Irpex lacteus]